MRAILIKEVLVVALVFAAYFLSANAEEGIEAQTMPAFECTAEAYRNR